jgi:hypothetical protein
MAALELDLRLSLYGSAQADSGIKVLSSSETESGGFTAIEVIQKPGDCKPVVDYEPD